jgi:hypothetical protein
MEKRILFYFNFTDLRLIARIEKGINYNFISRIRRNRHQTTDISRKGEKNNEFHEERVK